MGRQSNAIARLCAQCVRYLSRNGLSWIGRAGCAFFRQSFVVRSIRVSTMGLQSARASLSPRLAKESAMPSIANRMEGSLEA
jgi:hypothetical protein